MIYILASYNNVLCYELRTFLKQLSSWCYAILVIEFPNLAKGFGKRIVLRAAGRWMSRPCVPFHFGCHSHARWVCTSWTSELTLWTKMRGNPGALETVDTSKERNLAQLDGPDPSKHG